MPILLMQAIFVSMNSYAVVPARFFVSPQELANPQTSNLTIISYNKVINSNRLSRSDLQARYIERGLEYGRLFMYQAAIKDFSQAITLLPSSALAYVHRAVAYARIEKNKQALADFEYALKLDAAYLPALKNRAALYFLQANYLLAAKDFEQYLRFRPDDIYRILWLYLSEVYANKNTTRIRKYLKDVDLQQWPGAIAQLYLGDLQLDPLLISLKKVLSTWDARHRCEAYYYIGQFYLFHGKKLQAIRYFDQAVKTKAKNLLEYEFSVVYLKKLQ
ncbi:MAG: hypothetical protein ACC707_09040 [Thiohalomonadales bacterium]